MLDGGADVDTVNSSDRHLDLNGNCEPHTSGIEADRVCRVPDSCQTTFSQHYISVHSYITLQAGR